MQLVFFLFFSFYFFFFIKGSQVSGGRVEVGSRWEMGGLDGKEGGETEVSM